MNYSEEERYLRAKKRVEKIKGFYGHLAAYVGVNLLILALQVYNNADDGEPLFDLNFGMAVMWGIGLAVHGLSVFGFHIILGKNWEERKLKQFMEEEERNSRKWE